MSENIIKYGLIIIKALLTIAFISAGVAKLSSAEMMVQTFEAVGMGQWLRYMTGAIEAIAPILLWVKGKQFIGAILLLCTMIGAVFAHFFLIGPSALPAIVLGILSAIVAYTYRDQNPLG